MCGQTIAVEGEEYLIKRLSSEDMFKESGVGHLPELYL